MIGAVALLIGAALGFLVAQVRAGRRVEQLRVELETARVRLESETASTGRLQATFESLAGQTLRSNSEMFLRMAREALGRDQAVASASLKERETAMSTTMAQLVEPLRAALEKAEAQVAVLERERRDAYATLRTQIEGLAEGHSQLQRETRNLVTALRRPEVRGRWGELTLRRLVELAGMSEHCDFTEQLHVASDDGALRPDLVVHMPDSRDLVVDVKTPLDAFLAALEAPTEEARALELKRHASHLETRIRQLSAKSYWAQFERSPEFAVLFLPGDQFLSAALAERPDLLETALKQNVIIATPSTLIALLKTVAYGWRQSAVAENAAVIRELGQELYRRLGTFTGHLGRAGNRLGAAVDAYNAAVGSLEKQVLPQARRFTDLGITADAPLAALESVDSLARVPVGVGPESLPATPPRESLASPTAGAGNASASPASAAPLSDAALAGAARAGRATPTAASRRARNDAAGGQESLPIGPAQDPSAPDRAFGSSADERSARTAGSRSRSGVTDVRDDVGSAPSGSGGGRDS
jgi:DNA recombination protein RmuC